ncbi:MAG UNVERIFIED_CONTAM: primosomal protein N' [Rickettsiaceae bacterium]
MQIAKVIIPKTKLFPLDYLVPEGVSVGELVIVSFREEELVGIVLELIDESEFKKLKPIIGVVSPKVILSKEYLDFLTKAKEYYFSEMGSIAKLALPVWGDIQSHSQVILGLDPRVHNSKMDSRVKHENDKRKTLTQEIIQPNLINLSPIQEIALKQIPKTGTSILHGITGSGKTEIYFHLIYKAVQEGKQALFLLPEIALSRQMIQRFEERFNTKAIIWNASVTKTKKCKIMEAIINGEAKIIIGARSALFLPYKNLGIIIVDEEHDLSYKQEDHVPYHARDMAVLRGFIAKIPVILGSATPSLESLYNAKNKKYNYIKLESRFGGANLPNIIPIDMKGKKEKDKWISPILKAAIEQTISKNEQVMLFLNRKGYSPFLICDSCGYKPSCSSCSSALVFHKSSDKLICHHCGYHTKPIDSCPECQSFKSMTPCGPGVERIYEEVSSYFPDARIQIMTKDEMQSSKNASSILNDIMEGNIDIIIGTQIITKGYHFPKLTMVGVIDTDVALSSSDMRAAENSFNLLHQLTGRAGREEIQGNIYMQTYNPKSQFITLLKAHNFDEFVNYELEARIKAEMPPIFKMASISFSDKNEATAKRIGREIGNKIPSSEDVTILGPAPALISKLHNQYRYKILLIAKTHQILHKSILKMLHSIDPKILNKLRIDIDPYNFL